MAEFFSSNVLLRYCNKKLIRVSWIDPVSYLCENRLQEFNNIIPRRQQNEQAQIKNLAAFVARFLTCVWSFCGHEPV